MNQKNQQSKDINPNPGDDGMNSRTIEIIIVVVGIMLIGAVIVGILKPVDRDEIRTVRTARGLEGVRIASFSPSGEIEQKVNFTIEFTHNMVEEHEVGIELETEPVNFNPNIPGRFMWISNHKLRFFPLTPLQAATSYKAIVNPDVANITDRTVTGDYTFEFNTAPLRVEKSYGEIIYEGHPDIETIVQWDVEFNYEVNPSHLKSYLEIYYYSNNRKVSLDYTIEPEIDSSRFLIRTVPINEGVDDKTITLMVIEGLMPVTGNLGLTSDYISTIKTHADLRIERVSAQVLEGARFIQIEFSTMVDANLAKEFINVEPKIGYRLISRGRYIQLLGDFRYSQWYTVEIKRGLTGYNAKELTRTFSQRVKIGDLPESIEFSHKGIYLPGLRSRHVSFETVNIERAILEVDKIYRNNLVYVMQNSSPYRYWGYGFDLGRRVHREEMDISPQKNRTIETPIDIGEFHDEGMKGIFNVSVRDAGRYWRSDSLLILVTDLGIVANMADDNLSIWVNSLNTLKAVQGAEITLFSRNNQIIASTKTNNQGLAQIDNLLAKVEAEEFEPFLIVVNYEDDMSFLKFSDCRMPLASFDVGGRPYLDSGFEAFVYADRDVFRPNDKGNFAAIVRGVKVTEPAAFPVKLDIFDPMNRPFDSNLQTIGDSGMVEFQIYFPDYALTGGYLAKLMIADDEVGRFDFNVEDFIPDKTKIEVDTDKESYQTGDDIKIHVKGEYLFGPPAAGRAVESSLIIRSAPFAPREWSEYTFGDSDRKFEETEIELGEETLDDNGEHTFQTRIPDNMKPPSALTGVVAATVREHGGRAVSSFKNVQIHHYPAYIGLRASQNRYAEIGKEFDVEFIVLDPDGRKIERDNLKVNIYSIIYNTVRERDNDGRYRFVSTKSVELEESFNVSTKDQDKFSFVPSIFGRYRIEVIDSQSDSTTSTHFYASGWGYAPWSLESPGKIELEVEKTSYKAGEKAKILVKSPFSGKLLLTVQQDEVYEFRTVELKENTATLEVAVKKEYTPNVYVMVTVIKPLDEYDGTSPMRAFGVVPLFVDSLEHNLDVEISTPEEIRPETKLDINLKIKNARGRAHVTVAAVDEGILQLTDYQTPDPFNFFYGKRRLSSEYFDIFSFILPELDEFRQKPAGDYAADVRKKHLSPVSIKRVEPVSLWSGILETDRNGNAKVSLDVPRFQGRLRVMAVAAKDSNIGSSEKFVFVRDKIVLDHSLPRFISANDEFILPVSVYNNTSGDGDFKIDLDIDGPVKIIGEPSKTIRVANEKEVATQFKIRVDNAIGKASFNVKVTGRGESSHDSTNVPIRPASPVITRTGSTLITSDSPAETNLPDNFVAGTEQGEIILSSFPDVKFTKSLQYLLRYPHGCVEQITSRLFPLLYFDNLAKVAEPELFEANSVWYFIDEGISKILSKQQQQGSFAYWPGGYQVNNWSSVYAAHFLIEARKAGYRVPDSTYDNMIEWLKIYTRRRFDNLQNRPQMLYELRTQTYACYVLSLAGDPPKDIVYYLKDNMLRHLPESSKFQLAHCFYIMGDKITAKELIPIEIYPVEVERETGYSFRSSVRENAIILNVLAEIDPTNTSIPILVKSLNDSIEGGRWFTTQDNAFALLAMGKVLSRNVDVKYEGEILLDGKPYKTFDDKGITVRDKELVGKKLTVRIKGEGDCYLYWQTFGVPVESDFDEYDKGIMVRREYLNRDGTPVDYNNIKQGDLIVGKITARATQRSVENVIIDDMLPAGLEIENPRLSSRAQISWLERESNQSDYMDLRDDRLLLYTSLNTQKDSVFYYALRAVTVGDFTLPPVSAEAMYDPSMTSVQSSGKVRVVE